MDKVDAPVRILKQDDEQQILYGVVMEPDAVDSHGDFTTKDEIEKAMVRFMRKSWRPIGLQHENLGHGVQIIENYIAPTDFTLGEEVVKAGSWVMGVYCPEPIWKDVKGGKYTGFSIGAMAVRQATE